MKVFLGPAPILLLVLILAACSGRGTSKRAALSENDTVTVPDTGYTGITQYMNGQVVVKEVTFKNGVRQGLMKSFYQDGKVRTTFWYENGLREDSSRWYYQEGQLFRTTPYKRDTIDGIQKQYYRNGRIKAKIGFEKGLRTSYLEEFTPDGKLVRGYPDLVVNVRDDYKTRGVYSISLSLSDKSTKVRYYRGEMANGRFDSAHCKQIDVIKGIGTLNLRKTGSTKKDYVGVIAEILTNFGNNNIVYRKIDLPYNDLD
jgi:hypothetical protein